MKSCIKLDSDKISNIPIGKFFKITLGKVFVDILIVIGLLILIFTTVPIAKNMYLQYNLLAKTLMILINGAIYGVILYPIACFLIVYFKRRCK